MSVSATLLKFFAASIALHFLLLMAQPHKFSGSRISNSPNTVIQIHLLTNSRENTKQPDLVQIATQKQSAVKQKSIRLTSNKIENTSIYAGKSLPSNKASQVLTDIIISRPFTIPTTIPTSTASQKKSPNFKASFKQTPTDDHTVTSESQTNDMKSSERQLVLAVLTEKKTESGKADRSASKDPINQPPSLSNDQLHQQFLTAIGKQPATPYTSLGSDKNKLETDITNNRSSQAALNSRLVHKQQHKRIIKQVNILLSRYLSYPPRARRRGWEGETLIGFHITRAGQLGNIHLTRSSGYSLLDQSALKTMEKIKNNNLLSTPGNLLQAMDMELPVIFRLTDS